MFNFNTLSNDMRAAFFLVCGENNIPVEITYRDCNGDQQKEILQFNFMNGGTTSHEHIVWFKGMDYGLYVSSIIDCRIALATDTAISIMAKSNEVGIYEYVDQKE